MASSKGWEQVEAERSIRITVGIDRIRKESGAFFRLISAAPDEETLVGWISERFDVDREVAIISLEQPVRRLMSMRENHHTG